MTTSSSVSFEEKDFDLPGGETPQPNQSSEQNLIPSANTPQSTDQNKEKEIENPDEGPTLKHDGYKVRPTTQVFLESIESILTCTVATSANLVTRALLPEINPGLIGGLFAASIDTAQYGMERFVTNRVGAKRDINHPIQQSNYFKSLSGFAFDVFRFGLNVGASYGGDLAGRTIAKLYHDDSSSNESKEIVDEFGAIGNALAVTLVAIIAKRKHYNSTNRTYLEPQEETIPLLKREIN